MAGGKCMYERYTEKRGWKECSSPLEHIHHIDPEGRTLARGRNPEKNTALPLCAKHHMRNTGTEEHSDRFSFHPDMGYAYQDYGSWKRQKQHRESILGRKLTRKELPSPFDEAAQEHTRMTKIGRRYHAGTPEVDHHYEDKMRVKAMAYATRTSKYKPKVKEHPRTDRTKRKRWYNIFFEK